jgi:hypothetical protein
LDIGNIGVVIPKALNCLSNLPMDYINKVLIESIVGFSTRVAVDNLNKIVCIDINENSNSIIQSKNNIMVLSMLKFLEEVHISNKYYQSRNSSNDIKLVYLNTSINSLSLSGDNISSTLINKHRIEKLNHLGPIGK